MPFSGKGNTMRKLIHLLAAVALIASTVQALPQAGDVFKEYRTKIQFYRVGEKWDWGGSNVHVNQWLKDENDEIALVDLDHAIYAEATVQYDQCHHGTHGLAIGFNDNDYQVLPVPEVIHELNEWYHYMFWVWPTVEIPLEHLKQDENQWRMRTDAEPKQDGWAQNLVYGVYLRVYYDPELKEHPAGSITAPKANTTLLVDATNLEVEVSADATSSNSSIRRVDFIANYHDLDYNGDGVYDEWKWVFNTNTNDIHNHLGTATSAPYAISWDTEWVPNQESPMQFAARIIDEDGVIYMTDVVENVKLNREDYFVELATPYNQPKTWVNRMGEHSCNIDVDSPIDGGYDVSDGLLYWQSWAGAYCSWMKINGQNLNAGAQDGLSYDYFEHFSPFSGNDTEVWNAGQNTLTTGPSDGGGHGMEVLFPGPQALLRIDGYTKTQDGRVLPAAQNLEAGAARVRCAGKSLDVNVPAAGAHTVRIVDARGATVRRAAATGASRHTFDLSGLSAGTYFARIASAGGTTTHRFVYGAAD
ncbi:MAG: T9SS type A sorting domain-containing protein [Chitinivibrionales bacterium]|nr:T9SS type A sorting domain-containing protein [Chitinivibrionales bacterium]MBD3397266.1 T9SS type A sorting domain-containing protein [Chitinivibrionales bacterium]